MFKQSTNTNKQPMLRERHHQAMEATSLFRTIDMAVVPSFGSTCRLSDFYRKSQRPAPTGHCLGFGGSSPASSSRSSVVVSCSQTPDDRRPPAISSDWRSFRARLVAGEQPGVLTTGSDLTSAAAPVVLDDKWAHPLQEPERGCLLIATEKLDGVHIFERTVILLLSSGPLGPAGIILNRPSLMSIKETRSTDLDVAGTFSDRPLFFGGPLEDGIFLLKPTAAEGDQSDSVGRSGVFEEVMRGVYYGTKESVGCAAEMVKRGAVGVRDFYFFDGYCGWEREQLREEIRAGYWSVAACSAAIIGLDSATAGVGMWEEVLGLVGDKKKLF